ncbi:unnamed protein product, partial [Candidula unifasciata]
NDTLDVSGTPLMYSVVYEAAQQVKNPNPKEIQAGRSTVFDTWLYNQPLNFSQGDKTAVPSIRAPGSGSDHAPLLQKAGITVVDIEYRYGSKYQMSQYPLYHTEYETFDLVKQQVDRNFEFHAAVGRVGAEIARHLADSRILPLNVTNYAAGLENCRLTLHRDFGTLLEENLGLDTYNKLESVIKGFAQDASRFEALLENVDKTNPYALREINDKLLLLEKAFLHPDGLPARPLK